MEAEEDPVAVHDPMMEAMGGDDDDDDDHHHHHLNDDGMMMEHHHHRHEEDLDFFDRQPTTADIFELKRASKRPSEWLKLLCKEWAEENLQLVESMDHKYLEFKPFLKGFLTSQLLCRLCIPSSSSRTVKTNDAPPPFDFWKMLNVQDEFDKAYIIAQVEKFCALYQIRSSSSIGSLEMMGSSSAATGAVMMSGGGGGGGANTPEAAAAAAAAAAVAAASGHFLSPETTAAAVAAAQLAASKAAAGGSGDGSHSPLLTSPTSAGMTGNRHNQVAASAAATAVDALTKAQRMARDAERALDNERKQTAKREQKRQTQERKMEKQREREQIQLQKMAEKNAREASREDKRKRKVEMREQRERFAQQQKEAALKRAAELVASNRVPIEITRGAAAAKEAAHKALQQMGATMGTISPTIEPPPRPPVAPAVAAIAEPTAVPVPGPKKIRSAIVVSNASDLHQIVTHSKNLWAKYNAIAKEHNQKVNWITVAKELGIHVKVREKYARMHSRAEQRGFDWVKYGHWKIKDHPEIFVEPTQAEQKARMPPPIPDPATTVLISELETPHNKDPPSIPAQEAMKAPPAYDDYMPDHDHEDGDVAGDHHAMGAADAAAVAAAAAVVDATGVGTHMASTAHHLGPQHSHGHHPSSDDNSHVHGARNDNDSGSSSGGLKEEDIPVPENHVVV